MSVLKMPAWATKPDAIALMYSEYMQHISTVAATSTRDQQAIINDLVYQCDELSKVHIAHIINSIMYCRTPDDIIRCIRTFIHLNQSEN